MSYSYSLTVIDEDGNMVVDHVLTADQAVKILAPALHHTMPASAQHEEREQPAPNQAAKPVRRISKENTRGKRRVDPGFEKRVTKILDLAAKGWKASDIADKLGCPKQTVYNTISRRGGGVRATTKRDATNRGNPKPCCGSTGARHFKTCPEYGKETIRDFAPEQSKKESAALGPDQYEAVRDAMHDRDFSSAEYALSHKLSPREVNAAVRSTNFEDYLDSR